METWRRCSRTCACTLERRGKPGAGHIAAFAGGIGASHFRRLQCCHGWHWCPYRRRHRRHRPQLPCRATPLHRRSLHHKGGRPRASGVLWALESALVQKVPWATFRNEVHIKEKRTGERLPWYRTSTFTRSCGWPRTRRAPSRAAWRSGSAWCAASGRRGARPGASRRSRGPSVRACMSPAGARRGAWGAL